MSRRLASSIVLGCLFGAAAVATSPPALAQQQEVESAALINSLYTKHFTTKVQTEVNFLNDELDGPFNGARRPVDLDVAALRPRHDREPLVDPWIMRACREAQLRLHAIG